MSTPLVTVSIPARDAEKTLIAALKSIQNQTLRETEIILVDHKSKDNTSEIMVESARLDSRIKVLKCTGSFVEAANLAWKAGSAPMIARMDSDDVAHATRLEEQVRHMQENPNLSACGTLVKIVKRNEAGTVGPADEGYKRYENWINSVISPEDIYRERFVDSPIANPTSMIRRDSMEKLGGYADPEWAEDYDLWLRALENGFCVGKVDKILLDWFDAPDRSTRTIARYDLSQFQIAKAHFLSRIPIVQERGVVICGAGPIGKEMAQLLAGKDITIHAFIEVNQRQIGNTIHGIPVLADSALPAYKSEAVALSAVGQAGARAKIRDLALNSHFIEGETFFCVA